MADLLVAALVVSHGLDAFPHVAWFVVLKVLLNTLFVPVFASWMPLFTSFHALL